MARRTTTDPDSAARARLLDAVEHLETSLFSLGLYGLQRFTPSSLTTLEALQQSAHHGGLFTVERNLEALATQSRRYLERDPLFRMDAFTTTLNRVWLTLRAVRSRLDRGDNPEAMVDLLGEGRRTYVARPDPMVLQCLAASGWVSDTDYVGVTVLFAAEGEGDALYECSSAKPTMYFGTDPRQLLYQYVSDSVAQPLSDLLHGAFTFYNPKVSHDRRLSLHKELVVKSATYTGIRAYEPFKVASFADILGRIRARGVSVVAGLDAVHCLIEPASVSALVTDDKTARCHAELRDRQNAPMTLEVSLREENNFLVDNLEQLYGRGRNTLRPSALFGRVTAREGGLKFFPLTALFDQSLSLSGRGKNSVHEVHLSLESLVRGKVRVS